MKKVYLETVKFKSRTRRMSEIMREEVGFDRINSLYRS